MTKGGVKALQDLPTVEAALETMLAQVSALGTEPVAVVEADGRWLATDVAASRDHPPFDASAMDGWAVRSRDMDDGVFRVIGESVAGRRYDGVLQPGETVRISTGAPLPAGGDRVVLQEDATREDQVLRITGTRSSKTHVRAQACDFRQGQTLLNAGLRLDPWRLALAASAGVGSVVCGVSPRVAVLATGDELVEPGRSAGPDQIYDSATPALAAVVARHGGLAQRLSIVGDRRSDLVRAVGTASFDVLVTVGGASVGDHDLVKPALRELGAVIVVEGVAMRPGKPVWFAVLPDGRPVLGLPGNPASALVCAELFLGPLLSRVQGGPGGLRFTMAILGDALPANGPREHFLRARATVGDDGVYRVVPFEDQDSSLVSVMAASNTLVRRPPFALAAAAETSVSVLRSTL